MRFIPHFISILFFLCCAAPKDQITDMIMTVNGPIEASDMGLTLEHEHAIVDFAGAEKVRQPRYPIGQALDTLLPYFAKMKSFGVQTMIECTPNYIGRDVRLLKALSDETGIHFLTNTGYYAAAGKKYVPVHAYHETAEQLAQKWTEEWENGIDATGIKPGFIKLGVGQRALDSLEQKIVAAGALTHLATGLKIAIHTGGADAAFDEVDILEAHGVDPKALIVVHAQNIPAKDQLALAKKGAWISLDGINESPESISKYTDFLVQLKTQGYTKQTLISQDAYWSVEKKASDEIYFQHHGSFYSAIFDALIPALKKAGFSSEDIDQLLISNPAKAYEIEILRL
jgi:predicted metal-dependent phosphotriesterase family hydrolase